MQVSDKPSRAQMVLEALHSVKGGPLNYIGLLDRVGGSRLELDSVLKGLIDNKLVVRSTMGYSLVAPLGTITTAQVETVAQPIGPPVKRSPRARVPDDRRHLRMEPREEINCDYSPTAQLLQMAVGETLVEIPAEQMDQIADWWRRERAQP